MEFSEELPYGLIDSGVVQQFPNVESLPLTVSTPSSMALFQNAMVSQGHTSHGELYSDRDFNIANSVKAGEEESATPSTSPSRSASPSPPSHRTLLDKPLEQLTEEDIMHLTREDCRRYLKQKGMRRPSWNKSQAIQQVLSLKGLFDSKDDDDKYFRPSTCPKKFKANSSSIEEVPGNSTGAIDASQIDAGKEMCANAGKARPVNPYATRQPGDNHWTHPQAKIPTAIDTPSGSSPAYMCTNQIAATSLEFEDSRSSPQKICYLCAHTSGLPVMEQTTQLTIFYSGMVNVYDSVPEDQARAIMLLAERSNRSRPLLCSHLQKSTNSPVTTQCINASSRPMPQYVQSTVATTEVSSATGRASMPVHVSQNLKATHSEQPSRKACLQRYLEKRRGRYTVRSPCAPPAKRVDGNVFSSQLMSETYKFNSYLEMLGPPLALHPNSSQMQLPTQSNSGSETSSSPHLRSCSSS